MDSRFYIRLSALVAIVSIFVVENAWACPGCAGSMDKNGSYAKLVYILGGFILLTYLPFSILYGMIIKNRNFNKQLTSESEIK